MIGVVIFQQGKILQELPQLFANLLSDPNSVIKGRTLEVFAQFAEETPHESIVPDSLQKDPKLQENVVNYLNQVQEKQILDGSYSENHTKKCSLTY